MAIVATTLQQSNPDVCRWQAHQPRPKARATTWSRLHKTENLSGGSKPLHRPSLLGSKAGVSVSMCPSLPAWAPTVRGPKKKYMMSEAARRSGSSICPSDLLNRTSKLTLHAVTHMSACAHCHTLPFGWPDSCSNLHHMSPQLPATCRLEAFHTRWLLCCNNRHTPLPGINLQMPAPSPTRSTCLGPRNLLEKHTDKIGHKQLHTAWRINGDTTPADTSFKLPETCIHSHNQCCCCDMTAAARGDTLCRVGCNLGPMGPVCNRPSTLYQLPIGRQQ
jgi:hypothetical protein